MPIKGKDALKQLNDAVTEARQQVLEEESDAAKPRIIQSEPIRRHGVDAPVAAPSRNGATVEGERDAKISTRGKVALQRRLGKIERELGSLYALMEDPTVADIWRNNDGSLWVNRIGIGVTAIDDWMSDDVALALIGSVAESMKATVNAANPIFEGILPTADKSRFSASIPPVCNNGYMFCIRKRAVMSRTLDDYLEAGSATHNQVALLRKRIKLRDNFVIVGATGSGKALPLDAKILTPTGYVLMEDLHVDDLVIGKSGQPTKITGVFPQGMRTSWKITFSDETTTIADDEHLWAVRTKMDRSTHRDWSVKTTRELRKDLTYANEKSKWFIPMVESVKLTKKPIPGDAYQLGLLIGKRILDGSKEGRVKKNEEVALPFTEFLKKIDLFKKNKREVFIPDSYLWNDLKTRTKIFQGLMDGGAWFQKNTNHIAFATSSYQLAKDLVWLVQSFGGVARIGERSNHSYRVYIRLPEKFVPSQKPETIAAYRACTYRPPSRSIVKIERNGRKKMQCISVDAKDELYVIEHAIVTHNTTLGNAILREMSEGASASDRFIILEETAELQCEAVNRVEALTAPGVNMNDLIRACMRWSPKRICIGELRGGEAADLIKAWNTGHKGGITTIHSETARRSLDRLEDLIAESGQFPNKRRIADAVQCIVVIADIGRGKRKITEIIRVTGAVEGDYNLETMNLDSH